MFFYIVLDEYNYKLLIDKCEKKRNKEREKKKERKRMREKKKEKKREKEREKELLVGNQISTAVSHW